MKKGPIFVSILGAVLWFAGSSELFAAQNVYMIIELRGGGNSRHLHLKRNSPPPRVTLTPPEPGDREVRWNVSVDQASIPNANLIGLTSVSLWFPHASPLFVRSVTDNTPVRDVTIELAQGSGSTTLTLNPSFNRENLANNVDFVMPFAIYCTVDGGQNPSNHAHGLEQRGRQMIDGHHSHPECNVGP